MTDPVQGTRPPQPALLHDLVEQVERREAFAKRWWIQNQVTADVLVGTGWVLNALVPFGLAVLLYVPEQSRLPLTAGLLGASAAALSLHSVANALRFRDKADNQRRVLVAIQKVLASYRAGALSPAELAAGFGEALDLAADEPGSG